MHRGVVVAAELLTAAGIEPPREHSALEPIESQALCVEQPGATDSECKGLDCEEQELDQAAPGEDAVLMLEDDPASISTNHSSNVLVVLLSRPLIHLTAPLFAMWLAQEYASNGMDAWIVVFLEAHPTLGAFA